ncbi:3833_t:CDS:2 [Funneliformis mosseae]|uniref:3833_t:CDS:1 n=1 Tax=Funneliformis mosseae TaxID=27381 RepID=A0A9N9HG55_FUNMO|nr:3833_t:CDS:2 [Funneliformis mosseae]
MEKHKEQTVFERGMIIGLHKGNNHEAKGLTDIPPHSGRPPLLNKHES